MAKKGNGDAQTSILNLLWEEKREPSRGPKPALDIRQIAETAIAIADSEGLDAVSMQRVAQACGVATMALYRYVPDKAGLLALMIDIGLSDLPVLDDIHDGWRVQLEHWARQLWAIFRAHPWSLRATASIRILGPNELGWFEAAVRALSVSALSGAEKVDAVEAIVAFIRGRAFLFTGTPSQQYSQSASQTQNHLPELLHNYANRFPSLAEAEESGAFSTSEPGDLEFGLHLLLDGLGVQIAEAQKRKS